MNTKQNPGESFGARTLNYRAKLWAGRTVLLTNRMDWTGEQVVAGYAGQQQGDSALNQDALTEQKAKTSIRLMASLNPPKNPTAVTTALLHASGITSEKQFHPRFQPLSLSSPPR